MAVDADVVEYEVEAQPDVERLGALDKGFELTESVAFRARRIFSVTSSGFESTE